MKHSIITYGIGSVLVLVLALLFPLPFLPAPTCAHAHEVMQNESIPDTIPQGGIVFARTHAGNHVWLNGDSVRVSAAGWFIIATGRDTNAHLVLEIKAPTTPRRRMKIAVTARAWDIQRIDGLPQNQVSPNAETLARIKREGALIRTARARNGAEAFFEDGFHWPIRKTDDPNVGRLSGIFGSQRILNGQPRSPHRGVDFAGPIGTPIHSIARGVVVMAQEDLFYTGGTVMIDHGHGLLSVYAHMDSITVTQGEMVDPAQPIGTIGSTGRATGPHLHLGVSVHNTLIDPLPLLTNPPVFTR